MTLNYKDPLGPATQSQVNEFEEEMGFILPASYKQFLMTEGGGYAPQRGLADTPHWTPGINIQGIYGPQPDDYLDIRKTRQLWHIPKCFLLFARDPGGQLFVMDLRSDPNCYGKIYVRDHDHAFNPKPFLSAKFFEEYDCDPEEAELYHFIANSFEEFIAMLKTDEEIDAE